MRKGYLCLVICLFYSYLLNAQTTIILTAPIEDGFVSDPLIITENNPFTELELKIGKSAVDGSPNLTSAIIPFQLPAIPEGEEITEATLKVYVSFGREWIEDECHVDLYGLPYKNTSVISSNDHYAGVYIDSDDTVVGIEDDYFAKNVAVGNKDTPRFEETSSSGNGKLVDYLKSQYTAGAVAGDYVFLRLSIDLPDMTGSQYFGVHGGEGENPATLSVTHAVATNVAPILASIGDQSVQTTENLTIAISASDTNGDALSFSVSDNLPPSAVFTDHGNATATLQITDAGDIATYSDIIVTVTDGELDDSESFEIDVIAQAPNVPPVLMAIGDLEVDQYGYAKLEITATDEDDDVLFFSISDNLPSSGSLIDNGDGTAYIEVISELGIGEYSDIVITVSDGSDADTESINISIVERDPDQLMNLDTPTGDRFTVSNKTWPAQHGEADVSYWHDDKVGVVTITIDDNIESDHAWWLSMQETYPELKFTWFVIENQVTDWSKYQTLVNAGNEINGHDDCDINEGTDGNYRIALEDIRNEINNNTSTSASTFAYPCGEEGKEHVARDVYIGMRGTFGVLNHANSINYLALNSRSATNSDADIDNILDETGAVRLYDESYYRGWYSTHYHSIADKKTATESHLSYINDRSDNVWIAGFSEAMQYGQERDSHELNIDEVNDLSIKFTLTDHMKDVVFDLPLTVKIRVNNDWKSAIALQNGVVRKATLISHEGNKYLLVKAVPDRGQVEITGSTEEKVNHAPVLSPVGNQSLSNSETTSVTVTASDEDGDFLYFNASDELPSFATFTDNQDGTATLVITPSENDTGLNENITISVSDGIDEDDEVISVEVTAFSGTVRFCDPINGDNTNDGSQANPWASFSSALSAGKTIDDGDLIYLMTGEHGVPSIADKAFANGVTVKPFAGEDPNLTGLIVARSTNWIFSGIKIDGSNSNLDKLGFLVTGDINSTDITFKNCLIQSAPESSTWTISDWYANSVGGMDMRGTDIVVEYTTIRNTYHAMSLRGDNSRASYNLIDNFAGDGMRGLGNHQVFEYNIIRDCYVEDYATNHDDAFQTYILTEDPKSEGMILRFNTILLFEDPITQFVIDNDLIGESMQGIIITDGYGDGWIVENNLLVTDHYHGITLYGARNSRIQNNTVIKHPYFTDNKIPWIEIDDNPKTNQTNFNNVIRNNLAGDISFDKFDETSTVEGNLQIGLNSSSNYEDYFVDYTDGKYLTKQGSPAINTGVNADLTALDLAGNQRLSNGTVDAGAYEYYSDGLPAITPIDDVVMFVGDSESISIAATDPNDKPIALSVENLPAFGTFTDNGDGTASIIFNPNEGEEGNYSSIRVTADNEELTISETFDLIVMVVNTAPVLASIGDQEVLEEMSLEVPVTASDAEGDLLTISLANAPSFVALLDNNDGSGELQINPVEEDAGSYTFNVIVSDGELMDEEEITLTVSRQNTAPILSPIEDQSTVENTSLEVTILASDAENDDLVFSIEGAPNFVTLTDFTDGTGKLVINPIKGDAGDYTFKVVVSDSELMDDQEVNLKVAEEDILALDSDSNEGEISIYPNPSTTRFFSIETRNSIVKSVQLRDVSGKNLSNRMRIEYLSTGSMRVFISSDLPNNMYILSLQLASKTINRVIIVE